MDKKYNYYDYMYMRFFCKRNNFCLVLLKKKMYYIDMIRYIILVI